MLPNILKCTVPIRTNYIAEMSALLWSNTELPSAPHTPHPVEPHPPGPTPSLQRMCPYCLCTPRGPSSFLTAQCDPRPCSMLGPMSILSRGFCRPSLTLPCVQEQASFCLSTASCLLCHRVIQVPGVLWKSYRKIHIPDH